MTTATIPSFVSLARLMVICQASERQIQSAAEALQIAPVERRNGQTWYAEQDGERISDRLRKAGT